MICMHRELKLFIEANSHLLESGDFEELFERCDSFMRPELSMALMAADINPFTGMVSTPRDMFFHTDITTIEVPDGVQTLGAGTFALCYDLKNVFLPESLRKIGANAFQECTSLTRMSIPQKVTDLGVHCFQYCSSLKSVAIPGSVNYIPSQCFADCKSLTSVDLHEGTTMIGPQAFIKCEKLQRIQIPESIKVIGNACFVNCQLTNITYLGSSAQWEKIDFGVGALGNNEVTILCMKDHHNITYTPK